MSTARNAKMLVSRRRRARRDSDGEESVALPEDSQSEGSVLSDLDEDADMDAEGSDLSDADVTETEGRSKLTAGTNGKEERGADGKSRMARKAKNVRPLGKSATPPKVEPVFTTSADTEAMMNGLEIADDAEQGAAVDFEDMGAVQQTPEVKGASNESAHVSGAKPEPLAERRRREHDEYKKKRESDPTFIPNRGGFFMHDPRTPDQRGFVSSGRGRGRGRGFIGGPFAPTTQAAQVEKSDDALWAHDLHESVNEPNNRSHAAFARQPVSSRYAPAPASTAPSQGTLSARPLNFSTSKLLGNVQVRVLLPSMKAAAPFPAVPLSQHTRLPDHRPPLRRDKPVRVSLPDHAPRYIFPSQDRSFIFIPRAFRPNQQGFARSRGSFGGPHSRRTSAYGGSNYTPSVAMSRRSSLAQEMPRDMFSSVDSGSYRSSAQPARPVVRLPQGAPYPNSDASPAGSFAGPGYQSYPLPQTPVVEHYRETSTMHQPRPQKTISVSGIESPASLALHAPQQQSQPPFQNQLPQHMAGSNVGAQPAGLESSAGPYYSYNHGQGPTGTPLSNIPERAIHAQPFQPPMAGYGPPFYPHFAQQAYYYPPANQQYRAMPGGIPPQADYAAPDAQIAAGPPAVDQQSGLVAQERNGMVYYVDASQLPQYPPQEQYQGQGRGQESYLQMPSYAVPGMGGMLTPSPEGGFYYPPVATESMYYTQPQ